MTATLPYFMKQARLNKHTTGAAIAAFSLEAASILWPELKPKFDSIFRLAVIYGLFSARDSFTRYEPPNTPTDPPSKPPSKFKRWTPRVLFNVCLAALALIIVIGCKAPPTAGGPAQVDALTVEAVQIGVSTAVSYGLRNSPQTADYIRAVQPVVCSLLTTERLSPRELVDAIEASNAKILKTPEGALVINGALLVYFAATANLAQTDQKRPYAEALCNGLAIGLQIAPTTTATRSRTRPDNSGNWPLLSAR